MNAPRLKGQARKAVEHRGSHLQIIACAGSGKTEVVAQRVANLLSDGIDPTSVVAFTFTDKAAEELKHRIEQRVEERLGTAFLGRMSGCFVGTIHSFCFRLLQANVARYETYDVLDEHRLAAFLTRISGQIGVQALEGKLFKSIETFTRNVDVVENELIPLKRLQEPMQGIVTRLYEELERYRFLTYGQVISRTVAELDVPDVFESVHSRLAHLIVDEYQDVNPAQEALIRRLAEPPVELCVVGDDDQAIYQWRGSDVQNIVEFKERYPKVATFEIVTNRRSRPKIIKVANEFAKTITGRLSKSMRPYREALGNEVVCWREPTEIDEAERIATTIEKLIRKGFQYRDMAVLVRSSTSYARLLKSFEAHHIPVQPAGRTGLFREPDAQLFGRTFAYLAENDWRPETYGPGEAVTLAGLIKDYEQLFSLSRTAKLKVRDRLQKWHEEVTAATTPADLVGDYYDLLSECEVAKWDLQDPTFVARLGALARCSAILADYESVRRRTRPDPGKPGDVVGGQDRGEWYYRWLAIHIQNWALGSFEGYEGEESFTLNAVDLTTVHKAKGLEWPIVFVPCVSAKRFPSIKTGQRQSWHLPERCFDRTRYEGTVNDERRLFYVAMTRARDWLSVSTHDTPNRQRVAPSPFIMHVAGGDPPPAKAFALPPPPETINNGDLLYVTFSELADFKICGLAYRLRNLIGFQPRLAPELGYGKAVHHVLRNVAEYTRRYKRPPTPAQLDLMFDEDFYLPAANRPAHRQMKKAARRLVQRYVDSYGDDLKRVWAVERPFELHLPTAVVSGRADVILEGQDGETSSLAIVDYKTATNESSDHDRQLQIYTDAGRREGLDVRAAYVHDLQEGERFSVDIEPARIEEAEAEVISVIDRLRARDFTPHPGKACKGCDVRPMCRHAVA